MAKRIKTITEEIEITNPEAKDDLLGYYKVELFGLLQHMPKKANTFQAIYGQFDKTAHKTIIYTASVWTDSTGEIYHCYISEFEDDLHRLMQA